MRFANSKRGATSGFPGSKGFPGPKRFPSQRFLPKLPNLPKSSVKMSKSTKTLLIVIIAFMVIGIIWLIARGGKGNEEENELNKFTSDLEISQVQLTGYNDASVKLSGSADEENVDSVTIIVYDEDNSQILKRKVSMGELQNNDFQVDLRITNTSRIKEVSITPTFLSESGEKVVGEVEDTYEVPESSKTIFSPEGENTANEETNNASQGNLSCASVSECDDNDNCTTDECSYEGKCIHSLIENCISCASFLQCDDNNACTTNVCSEGRCAYLSIPGCTPCGDFYTCEDNNACTENLCFQGRCIYQPIEGCKSCTLSSECGDSDSCTTDTCLNGACANTVISNCVSCTSVSQCEDNDVCTTNTCSGNKCVYTKINSCTDSDGCCPSGCNYDNDKDCSPVCNNGVIEGTEKCDGSNLNGATCASVRGSEYDGTLKCTNFCTFDTSSCKLACSCPDDGNACTTDACIGGVCQHTPIQNCCTSSSQCNDDNGCTTDACQNNVCVNTPSAGTLCTSDDNECTRDVCSSWGECVHTPLTGISCSSDGNLCTKDVCSPAGECAHNALTGTACADDNDACTVDICSSSGICGHVQKTSCTLNDGCCPFGCNYLNDNDCVQCRASNQETVCNDNNPCTDDICSNGICTHSAKPNCCTSSYQCNDNIVCTTDACQNNACVHIDIASCCVSSLDCPSGQTCSNNKCVIQSSGCTNECSSSGLKQCSGTSRYQTCGNYDSDSCLEWSSTTNCPSGQTCSGAGVCSSGSSTETCGDGTCSGGESCSTCSADCGTCSTPSGTVYYVSTSGSDSGAGTSQSAPWKTLQYAESHAAPGSTIALKRGDNWGLSSGSVLSISHGGNTGDPTVWDGDLWGTGGKAIISATGDHSDDHSAIVTITAAQHVVFQNIIVDGNNHYAFAGLSIGGNDWMDAPLKQNNERDITVQGCEVRNIGGSYANCLMTQTWHNDMYDIKIQNNYVHDCSTWCIGFYMGRQEEAGSTPSTVHNLYIGHNTITNCQKKSGDDGPGIGISGGVDVGVVEYNTITQGSGTPPSGIETAGDPDSLYAPKGLKVRYNDVKMNNRPSYVTQNGGPQQIEIYGNNFYTADPLDQATVIIYSNGPYNGASLNFHDNTIGSNGGLCFADQTGKATLASSNIFQNCKNR